jgi:hypothetical protein
MHRVPLARLTEIRESHGIDVVLYGGFPDSPLNGGRANFALDDAPTTSGRRPKLSPETLAEARRSFFQTVEEANCRGFAFLAALTNPLVDQDELTAENLAPVEWLISCSRRHGVRNGVIVNNPLLETRLRETHGRDLRYVSSCTRYFEADRILTPRDTIPRYLADAERYDLVIVTPQDSRREPVLRELSRRIPGRFATICNAYCADDCNSYHHYLATGRDNKRPLLEYRVSDMLSTALDVSGHCPSCPVLTGEVHRMDFRETARRQLAAGVRNLKIGRGFGDDLLEHVVDVVLHDQGRTTHARAVALEIE